MDTDALIDRLEDEGRRLAEAAGSRGWDEPVPACAGWTVRDVVVHTGGVHRWAATVVSGGTQDEIAAAGARIGEARDDGTVLEWFRAGHAGLVAALRAAPADLDVFSWLPAGSPREFWARRQAHETAIHRADAQGPGATFDRDFAEDGITEILAFGGRRTSTIPRAASLALCPDDGQALLLRFGGERTVVEAGTASTDVARADAMVRGSASDLYLWLWNRPSAAEVDGDAEIAALWGHYVRISWS